MNNKNISLVSIKDIRDKKIIKKISFLKKQYWNYSIKELNDWFRKNIDKKDIHNMILCSNKLVGYTCLRLGSYKLENKKNKIYYFDTLIIDKNYRKNNFGGIIMNFNNYIIKKSLTPSFLICEKLMIKFYDKYGWKNKIKKFSIINHDPRKKSVMYFNFKNENKISNKEIIFKI